MSRFLCSSSSASHDILLELIAKKGPFGTQKLYFQWLKGHIRFSLGLTADKYINKAK